jgi:serine/threonine protein kinase
MVFCASPGETLPAYHIIELLSENPTSRVFLAEREENLYIIKEQPKEYCFLPDLGYLKSLNFHGLPKIIDYYETPKSFIYSYEYINGITLTDAYESGMITMSGAAAITAKLCTIVSYLHSKSILHCDIKPDNILINKNDVFLIDFGIAHFYNKHIGSETALIGSQGYVSPELGYKKTDYRSDVYAIGMVLYYLLTGSSDIKELHKKVNDRTLRSIVSRAASYEVGRRYKTASKLQSVLTNYLSGRTYHPLRTVLTGLAFVLFFLAGVIIYPVISEKISTQIDQSAAEIYIFSDPIIEQAIRLNLGKSADEPVYPYELLGVESIYIAEDRAFASSDEHFAYLDEMIQSNISPQFSKFVSTVDLAACKNLKDVNIQFNALEDISFFERNVHIRDLNLNNTNVNDISVIRNFPMLKVLGVSGCPISDLSPIKDCTAIQYIYLDHVYADNFDFTVKGRTYSEIGLNYVNYQKFMPALSGITVKILRMDGCGITGFDEFTDVKVTEFLGLSNNNLTSTDGAERILAGSAKLEMN